MRRAAAAAAMAAACAPVGAPPPDILLITVDTLRADAVAPWGTEATMPPGGTPSIKALAAASHVWIEGVSHVPITLPSMASVMTGRLPVGHGVRHNLGYVLPAGVPTLAEKLSNLGYRTGAVTGTAILDRSTGIHRGFGHFDDGGTSEIMNVVPNRTAGEVVSLALDWWAETDDRPMFLWVHLYDPHHPYSPPVKYHPKGPKQDWLETVGPLLISRQLYLGEVAYVDREIGRLLDGLGLPRDGAVVALAGDHGEALGEHGEDTHGFLARRSTMRVPLMISVPGRNLPRPSGMAGLSQLGPTLLWLAGGDPQDLGPAPRLFTTGRDAPPQPFENLAAAEQYGWLPARGIQDGRWRLIQSGGLQLFDIAADPGETRDLLAKGTATDKLHAIAARLLRTLEATETAAADLQAQRNAQAAAVRPGETRRRMLAQLGYLEDKVEPSDARRPALEALPGLMARVRGRSYRLFAEDADAKGEPKLARLYRDAARALEALR